MEEALRESEENFRRSLDDSPLGVRIAGPTRGETLYANRAILDIYGYSSVEELKTTPVEKRLTPESYAELMIRMEKWQRGEYSPSQYEMSIVRKDGEIRHLQVFRKEVLWDGERRLQLIYQDITERKRAEEALQESEERFRDLFESANDLIQSVTPDGHFLYVNRMWQKVLGYSEKEIANLTLWDIIHPDSIPHCRGIFQKIISGETINDVEAVFVAKDGKLITVEGNANCRFEGGEPVATRGIFRDITERKQMEREIQERNEQLDAQNEELQSQTEELMKQQQELIEKTGEVEKANQLKSEFLANMSHGLRTPLNVIIGFSELVRDEVPGRLNKEQRQCLDDIQSSGKHLLNLINEVLDLSRIESGKTKLSLTNIALTEVAESLTRTMMPILAPRKQSLDIEIEKGLPLVHADKVQLNEVFLNLLSNATKFTPEGGKLKIEASREDSRCRVSVIDNGIGIRKEDQELIFEPFHQLDNPLTKDKRGTGLGLTLVKQIIEKHGGQIWVESEYGEGSRFIFTLPLATTD